MPRNVFLFFIEGNETSELATAQTRIHCAARNAIGAGPSEMRNAVRQKYASVSLYRSDAATHLAVAFSLALALLSLLLLLLILIWVVWVSARRDRPPTVWVEGRDVAVSLHPNGYAALPYRPPLRVCDVAVRCTGSFLGSMMQPTRVLTRRAAAFHSQWAEVVRGQFRRYYHQDNNNILSQQRKFVIDIDVCVTFFTFLPFGAYSWS